jgi:signal transduction histidine kinase
MVQGSGIGDQGSGTTPEASNFFKDGAVIPTKSGPSPQVTDRATAHLYIRTNRNGNRVSLEIEDNGPGIPDDVKDKILQPFFTTKKGTQGTGLGLSITHDIIKAHGGELTFSSEPGRTVFTILI